MAKKKLLIASLVALSLTVLALVAYIIVAQVTIEQYTPIGWWVIAVNPGQTAEIPFPHFAPFRAVMSEIWGASEATGFVMASENNCWVSWMGLNGDGTVTQGNADMSTGTTILKVKDVTLKRNSGPPLGQEKCGHTDPPKELGQPGHTLIIDARESKEGVSVTLIR